MVNESSIFNASILVVDDQEANLRLLEQMLSSAGYVSITSTMDPGKVCELYLENRYDLILLDLQMPGMDGFQVMEGLNAIETSSYVPVIVITAHPGHKLRALEAGAKDFISKPLDLVEVKTRIHNILEVRLLYKEIENNNRVLEQTVLERTRELKESQRQHLHAEKLSAIGKLSASIAHEFNNPLQGIISVLIGVKKRAILDQEDKKILDEAISECERMKNLIRSLQDFNRPSSGRQVLMDIHKSLDSILLLHKKDFMRRRISVILDYAEGLPQILAVPDQIKQVFLNLLANAADACEKPKGVITVSTWQERDRVAVAIKDTGSGIKTENIELIFQPFFSTKSEVKGTGLGLSVSYGIVKKHHGEFRVKSKPGEGATFTVLLPIKVE
jgi:signal transduction histidine kinase